MQARIVDAITVRRLKQRAVRDLHQNCRETALRGLVIKEVLETLGLWEDENIRGDNTCNPVDSYGAADTVRSHDCISGSRQERERNL